MRHTDDFHVPNSTIDELTSDQRLPQDIIKLKNAHVTEACFCLMLLSYTLLYLV